MGAASRLPQFLQGSVSTHVCFPRLWPPPTHSQTHLQPHAYLGGWMAANRKEGNREGAKGSSDEGTLPKDHTPLGDREFRSHTPAFGEMSVLVCDEAGVGGRGVWCLRAKVDRSAYQDSTTRVSEYVKREWRSSVGMGKGSGKAGGSQHLGSRGQAWEGPDPLLSNRDCSCQLWVLEIWVQSKEAPRSRAAMAVGSRGSNRSAWALQVCCSMGRGLVSLELAGVHVRTHTSAVCVHACAHACVCVCVFVCP